MSERTRASSVMTASARGKLVKARSRIVRQVAEGRMGEALLLLIAIVVKGVS